MSDLYNVLGLSRNADPKEIKKAYFDMAKTHHPDKGGDTEKFKEVQNAYDVLSDPEKKQMYDMTGNANPQAQPQPQGFPFGFGGGHPFGMNVDIGNLFGGMFGGGQGRKQGKRPKGSNKTHEISLSLHDFYYGKSLRFDLERQVFCGECTGQGCLNWKTCGDCKGSGVKEVLMQIGPGMMAVNRSPCGACNTEGKTKGTTCGKCDGKGLNNEAKVLESHIKAGANIGDVLVFEGMCSDNHDFEKPGDVMIRLSRADENIDLVRDGPSLRHECSISLSESLLGCERSIVNHPGYATAPLKFDIPCGTQNGEVIVLSGKGMPVAKGFGDLFVKVNVKATEDEKKSLVNHRVILQTVFTLMD